MHALTNACDSFPQQSREPSESTDGLISCQRRVGQELAVGAVSAPSRAARRLVQQRVHQIEVEVLGVVEQNSVMEQSAPPAPLGVACELPIMDGEVGRPDSDTPDGQNAGQPAE